MKRSILFLFLLATICVSAQNTPSDADAKYATDLIKPGVSIPDFKLRDSNGKWQKQSSISGHLGVPTAGKIFPTSKEW